MLLIHPRAQRAVARLFPALALLACAEAAVADSSVADSSVADSSGAGPAITDSFVADAAVAGGGGLVTTFYVAKFSGEAGWEDVMVNPAFSKYVDHYLAVAALSKEYARRFNGRLALEWEGQVGYDFGGQTYWEFNVVPVMGRWRFGAFEGFDTSVAFGLGLSFTSDLPEIEVELEGESNRELIYWVLELAAGPTDAPWALSLRLHHRSVGYGLFGEDGGMNALGLGMRWKF
jgi:hypothetical protein